MEILIVASTLGVMSAVAAVLAMWLALGSGRAIWRAILVIAGTSGAALAFCVISGEAEAEWLVLMGVVAATTASIFMLARILGFTLVKAAANQIRAEKLQFSVRQLLTLTAVVAVVAAGARLLLPIAMTPSAIVICLTATSCLGAVAPMAVWATLRPDLTVIKTLSLVVVAFLMAGVDYYVMEATNADPGLIWGSTVIVYTVALVGALLLLRARGFRLIHISKLGQQKSAVKLNVDATLGQPVK